MIEKPTETLSLRGVAKHSQSNGDRGAVLLREYYSAFVPLPKDHKRNFQPRWRMCQLIKTSGRSMLLCLWISLIAFSVCL